MRIKALTIHLVAIALLSPTVSCAVGIEPVQGDVEEVAALAEAITTQAPLFDSSCTATERSNLTATHSLLQDYVITGRNDLVKCFNDAVMSAGDLNFPEVISQLLQENVRTRYFCPKNSSRSWNGVAADGTEEIHIGTGNINNAPADLAGVAIHELSHTKGYFHPGPWGCPDCAEHPITVTNHISQCRAQNVPNGVSRTSMASSNEVILAQVGEAHDKNPTGYNDCFEREVAVGIQGRSGSLVDALGLTCRDTSNGFIYNNALHGGSGGTPFAVQCPANSSMVGLRGNGWSLLDNVGILCASDSSISAGTPNTFGVGGLNGGSGGVGWFRTCKPGHVIKAVRVRYGDTVERIDVVCQRYTSLRSVTLSSLGRLGGTGGEQSRDETCPSRSFMDKLYVVRDDNGIHRIGASCAVASNSAPLGSVTISSQAQHMVPFLGSGVPECNGSGPGSDCGNNFGLYAQAQQCASTNSVLVGLRVYTNGWIRALRGVCAADATAWSTGSSTATQDMGIIGVTTGTSLSSAICPSKSFLAGWRIVSGAFIDSIVPFCRRM